MISRDTSEKPEVSQIENPFTSTPSSSSIENTFRMAQVLQKKKEYKNAIIKFTEVANSIEKAIAINPAAYREIHWAIFSIGAISDIYFEMKDFKKSNAFRSSQRKFIDVMQSLKAQNDQNSDDEDTNPSELSFYSIAVAGRQYLACFDSFREALALPDTPPPTDPQEFLKKLKEAKQKDEDARIEEITRLLNEEADKREREIQNSFIKRTLYNISEHPVKFIICVILFTFVIMFLVQIIPRRNNVPQSTDSQMEYLKQYVKKYEKEHPDEVKKKRESIKKQSEKMKIKDEGEELT